MRRCIAALRHHSLWRCFRHLADTRQLRPATAAATRLTRRSESRALQQWRQVAVRRSAALLLAGRALRRWEQSSLVFSMVLWGSWAQRMLLLHQTVSRWQQHMVSKALMCWQQMSELRSSMVMMARWALQRWEQSSLVWAVAVWGRWAVTRRHRRS